MRKDLADLKARGVPFDQAFDQAVRRIVWPHDKQSRAEWKRVVQQTRPAWRNCYLDIGEALDVEHLVGALVHEVDLHDEEALLTAA